jgi:hypothetical protein
MADPDSVQSETGRSDRRSLAHSLVHPQVLGAVVAGLLAIVGTIVGTVLGGWMGVALSRPNTKEVGREAWDIVQSRLVRARTLWGNRHADDAARARDAAEIVMFGRTQSNQGQTFDTSEISVLMRRIARARGESGSQQWPCKVQVLGLEACAFSGAPDQPNPHDNKRTFEDYLKDLVDEFDAKVKMP